MERISFAKRLVAIIIDLVAIVILTFLLSIVVAWIFPTESTHGLDGEFIAFLFASMLFLMVLNLLWIAWEGFTGAALGKRIMKIKIYQADGTKSSIGRLMMRSLIKFSFFIFNYIVLILSLKVSSEPMLIRIIGGIMHLLCIIIFIGGFAIFGKNKQTLHDKLTSTAVFKNHEESKMT